MHVQAFQSYVVRVRLYEIFHVKFLQCQLSKHLGKVIREGRADEELRIYYLNVRIPRADCAETASIHLVW